MAGLFTPEVLAPLVASGIALGGAIDGALALAFQHPIVAVKAFAGLTALSSFVSNFRALAEVQESIVSCTRPLDFRGRKLGPAEPYIVPLRKLFFWYALFVFYQVVSHVTGAAGQANLAGIVTEFALQSMLILLVFYRWRSIRAIAQENYQDQGEKFARFNKLLDEALADKRINISVLLGSIAIFPIAALAPRVIEIALERPSELDQVLSLAVSLFKS